MPNNKEKTPNTSPEPVKADSSAEAILVKLQEMEKRLEDRQKEQEEREKKLDLREAELIKSVQAMKSVNAEEIAKVEKTHQSKVDAMKENLSKQPLVTMYVPLVGGEKIGATIPVTLNGYRVNIPKGVYVDVPQQIADLLKDHLQQTEEAGRRWRLDLRGEQQKEGVSFNQALN